MILVTGGAGFIGGNFVLDWLANPAAEGIINLDKLTYAGNEIVYNIEQIKNVIDSFISKKDNDISLLVSNYNTNGFKIKQNIYDHINSVWTHERKQILLGYINEIKTFASQEYENELIISLSSFLNCMDITTKNIINNI